MSPWGGGDMEEKFDAHRLKLWSSQDIEGPVSGCVGHAHVASKFQEPALRDLRHLNIQDNKAMQRTPGASVC